MINYCLLSYCTEYGCTGDIETRFDESACFGDTFHDMIDNKKKYNCEYTIRVFKGEFKAKCGKNNNCSLTKEQLSYFINSIKRICDFSFKIEEKDEWFNIIVNINARKTKHKFILTWIRYCYEYPSNFCVYYAFKLKDKFKHISFFNLVNLIESTLYTGMRGCHRLTDPAYNSYTTSFKLKELKEYLDMNDEKDLFNAVKHFCTQSYLGRLMLKTKNDCEGAYISNSLFEEVKENNKLIKTK